MSTDLGTMTEGTATLSLETSTGSSDLAGEAKSFMQSKWMWVALLVVVVGGYWWYKNKYNS